MAYVLFIAERTVKCHASGVALYCNTQELRLGQGRRLRKGGTISGAQARLIRSSFHGGKNWSNASGGGTILRY